MLTFAPGGSHRIKTSSSTMNLATAARIWITLGLRQKGVLMGSAATGAGSSSITGMIVPFSLNYILEGFEIFGLRCYWDQRWVRNGYGSVSCAHAEQGLLSHCKTIISPLAAWWRRRRAVVNSVLSHVEWLAWSCGQKHLLSSEGNLSL